MFISVGNTSVNLVQEVLSLRICEKNPQSTGACHWLFLSHFANHVPGSSCSSCQNHSCSRFDVEDLPMDVLYWFIVFLNHSHFKSGIVWKTSKEIHRPHKGLSQSFIPVLILQGSISCFSDIPQQIGLPSFKEDVVHSSSINPPTLLMLSLSISPFPSFLLLLFPLSLH